jgi:hypothetical protein
VLPTEEHPEGKGIDVCSTTGASSQGTGLGLIVAGAAIAATARRRRR